MNGNEIKPGNELFGVTHWAQWFPLPRTPKYEVFKYFGHSVDTGLYYFQHRKHRSMWIMRSFHQMTTDPTFRPFLFDTAKMGIEYLRPNGPTGA